MTSRWVGFEKLSNPAPGEDSSDSEDDPDAVQRFHRKISTKHNIKTATATKEGYLLKQTSFQRWRRRYFKLKGKKLYYAKDAKAVIFDEVEVSNISIADCRSRHVSHGFQLITPTRKLQLCAESNKEMDDWISALKSVSTKEEYEGGEAEDFLSGQHQWFASTHARPTYCNVCRDPLFGVTPHGLSCEICKYKVHKRCAIKAINNCKWTTLASIGHDIIEDQQGNITMPHQWMEGNLPVSSKCAVCDKTCGSVLRLQDWRCLWCRATVHTACRPLLDIKCPLGLAKVSVVPPTALHSIGTDEAWDVMRPTGCSPLLVFVNSRSGENQGVKFLRRFKQLLNPAQVFDLIHGGPSLGLRLFRHFDPFRILICSGDGSVGWVLSEIDRLVMQKQCQVGVLPLGTGNDLARVLGWGSSCDDDTHLPQLLDKYEKASTKMLDRWSVMTLERSGGMPRAASTLDELQLATAITAGETSVLAQLAQILQAEQKSVVVGSAKILCETVKELTARVAASSLSQSDETLNEKCQMLNSKLENLIQVLNMEGDEKTDGMSEKKEKDISNMMEKEKGNSSVLLRANSLKKAVKQLAEYTEQAVDQQSRSGHSPSNILDVPSFNSSGQSGPRSLMTIDSSSSVETSQSGSPRPHPLLHLPSPFPSRHPSTGDIRLTALSPLPDVRRESATDDLLTLPAPDMFADARRSFSLDPEHRLAVPSIHFGDTEANSSLWDNVVSSLNDDTRSLMGSRRGSANSRRDSALQFDSLPEEEDEYLRVTTGNNHRPSVCSLTENAFCSGGVEMDLAHIDSSESPSEEASPPAASASPPSPMRRSKTVGGLGAPPAPAPPKSPSLGPPFFTAMKTGMDSNRLADSRDSTERAEEGDVFEINPEKTRRSFDGWSRKDSTRLYPHCDIDITADIDLEPELRCSLARFVEGNDIARMSFRKKPRAVVPPPPPDIDIVQINFKGSNGDLRKEWDEELTLDDAKPSDALKARASGCHSDTDEDDDDLDRGPPPVPQFSMVVDPPSPDHDAPSRRVSTDSMGRPMSGLLFASPQATRRVSNCSLLNPELIQAFADKGRSKSVDKTEDVVKKLPIINPLVRLPAWPNVSACSGLVSKVLLANADALCATAAPLMDVDETLLEGFNERCVMNNYFGIGIDAKITLDFHHKREEHPEKCRSRTKNYMWYGVLGSREWLQKTYKNLEQRVQLECDGQRIPLPSLQGIVVLNIPSFMGGTNFWGGTKENDCFLAPSFDDKILEVVAVFGSMQMAASRLINLQHHRIAQCQTVQINILGDEGVPIQVDGEAWVQPPGVIRIIHKSRMQTLCRNRALENSLRAWEEKQRHNVHTSHQVSQTSTATREPSLAAAPASLNEEESRLLLGFIEVTTTLVKCVKLLAIAHPALERGLYELAVKTSEALDAIHPGGKILEGPALRTALTRLVNAAKDLYEESCSVLREKAHQLKIREDFEGKLSGALADMEVELRKYSVDSYGEVHLHHIFEQGGAKGRGRGLFWLKRRRHMQRQREAANWGVTEVSAWLESLQLSEYVDSFSKNDIRGRELLALARRDLKDLGVTKVGHVKRILQAIRELTI